MSDFFEQQYNEDLLDDEEVEIEIDDNDEAEQQKAQQKERTAQGQINAYQRKIDSGEITFDEAPKWMTNDLKPKIEVEPEVTLKEKIKAELLEDMEFEKLQATLPEVSEEQADEMNKLIEQEIKLGKSKTKALKYAMFELGIVQESKQFSFPRIKTQIKEKKKTDPTEDFYVSNLPKGFK